MEIPETVKMQRLIEQLLKSCDRATPGPLKYREEREEKEYGSYGDVHSLADRKSLRGQQSMVSETMWLEDGVFLCDARDYFPGSLKALQEIIALVFVISSITLLSAVVSAIAVNRFHPFNI